MSTITLEQDLQKHIENQGYRVTFSNSSGAMHWYVLYYGQEVKRGCLLFSWRAHSRAARHARRAIKDHKRALRLLGGVA